jgi:hypothetical protein
VRREVIGPDTFGGAIGADGFDERHDGAVAVTIRPQTHLSGPCLVVLPGEVGIGHVLDRAAAELRLDRAHVQTRGAHVDRCSLQRVAGFGPRPEVLVLPVDLLRPGAARVREQRERCPTAFSASVPSAWSCSPRSRGVESGVENRVHTRNSITKSWNRGIWDRLADMENGISNPTVAGSNPAGRDANQSVESGDSADSAAQSDHRQNAGQDTETIPNSGVELGVGIRPLNVLIGCECSGRVRSAFRARGHNAWSCDLQPAEDGSPFHIQGDVLDGTAAAGPTVGHRHLSPRLHLPVQLRRALAAHERPAAGR